MVITDRVRAVVGARELLWNLTLRELRTKYRKSLLGWTWSMINPLATVAIYTFVFGYVFKAATPVGNPSGVEVYALYLLCGVLPWGFHTLVMNLGMASIVSNGALVRKVAFPREVLVLSNSLHGVVQFSIEMGVLSVVLFFFGAHFVPWIPLVIIQMLLLAIFSTGIAMVLATLYVYFRDISYLWTIVTQVWFFATPIVYSETRLAGINPTVHTILSWNPMAIFIRGFRRLLYDGRFQGWDNLGACAVMATVSIGVGWSLFHRLSGRFAEEL